MAIKWIKIDQPYGARHFSPETDMVIEAFKYGVVELWNEPTVPKNTCIQMNSVRSAKRHVTKIVEANR